MITRLILQIVEPEDRVVIQEVKEVDNKLSDKLDSDVLHELLDNTIGVVAVEIAARLQEDG